MIALLAGEESPGGREAWPFQGDEADHPIDTWRHALAGFIDDHWDKLEPQLTCPAKTRDPRACFGCPGTQVIACIVDNAANEHLIQEHKLTRRTPE